MRRFVFLLFFPAWCFYPIRSQKNKCGRSKFYVRRKMADGALLVATFLSILMLANRGPLNLSASASRASVSIHPHADTIQVKPYKSLKEFKASLYDKEGKLLKKSERKKLLKAQIKGLKQADMSEGDRAAMIILSVVLAGLALLGILALSCNLSCSGYEVASTIVGIGGLVLIGFLLYAAIKGINRKYNREKAATSSKEPSS